MTAKLYLLSAGGVATFAGGGWLAHAAGRYSQQYSQDIERIAGFLIIGGLSFIGAGLGLCLGAP